MSTRLKVFEQNLKVFCYFIVIKKLLNIRRDFTLG